MSVRTIPCYYCENQSPKVKELGDLKIEYAYTQDDLIQKLLQKAEDVIILKTGSFEEIEKQINETVNPTEAQKKFFEKILLLKWEF